MAGRKVQGTAEMYTKEANKGLASDPGKFF